MKGLFDAILGRLRRSEPLPTRTTLPGASSASIRTIEHALRDHFAPVVRSVGFKGSGRNFRRVSGDLVFAVNVQGSMGGGAFCVNLAIHPLALIEGDPAKLKEYQCLLRRRLSAADRADQWWNYTDDPASLVAAASSAAKLFATRGVALFEAQGGASPPLLTITPDELADDPDFSGFDAAVPLMALALAQLHARRGEGAKASAFARVGLASLPPHAVEIIAQLNALTQDA